MKIGLPIFSFSYIFGISNTFPKIILLKESGPELVGLFAPAIALINLYKMLPNALARYIYPNMTYRLGKTDNPMSIWPMAWKSAIGALIAGIPCFIIGSIAIGPTIQHFLPKYQEAIPAMYWCLGAGIFLGPRIAVNALFSLKAWKLATIYTGVFSFSSWIFPWIGIRNFENELVGAGAGIFFSYLTIFLCAMPCVYLATHKKFT
jgi:O-antigen/teichoic acid export membrane protein